MDKREKELKAKEEYLRAKEADLRRREQGLIEEDLKHMDKEIAMEIQVAKAKTGNPVWTNLLMGGVPFGSNVLVYGPPFVGKETMVCQFIAEGLKKGIPALWGTTDKTPAGLREEMTRVPPSYEEYEALGLVAYVDSYSRSMGDTTEDPYTLYVEEPTAHDRIMTAVEETAKKFLEGHEYYRWPSGPSPRLSPTPTPTPPSASSIRSAGGAKGPGGVDVHHREEACTGSRRSRCWGPSWTA